MGNLTKSIIILLTLATASFGQGAPDQRTEVITKKLNSITIPKLRLQKAHVSEAVKLVEFLIKKHDPEKKGVAITLIESGDEPRITLSMDNAKVHELLGRIGEIATLSVEVEATGVTLRNPEGKVKPVVKKAPKVIVKKPEVGEVMEIAFVSLQGEEIDLAKMKGKVVLVDFWATWCKPCIAELPHMKNAYEAFHDKGFEVVAISLDRNQEKLEAFIKTNEITWAQDFTGEMWKTPLAVKFGINSIPATFLIGKDGKIAATNLRGENLVKKVKEELAKETP